MLLTPALDVGLARFGGAGVDSCSPETRGTQTFRSLSPGSGLMGILMSMLAQTVGFPVPEGGAGQLSTRTGRPSALRWRARFAASHEVVEVMVERPACIGCSHC